MLIFYKERDICTVKKMKKSLLWIAILGSFSLFSGCYQVHSDDDLRSVPVTNNPNIIPSSNDGGGFGRFIPM